jgi:hypothetical protein
MDNHETGYHILKSKNYITIRNSDFNMNVNIFNY